MSIHIYPTHCGVDPSGSEISTTDSLIQEFQEFEAQVYSGALFDQNCRTSTPLTENKNCLPSQTMNIPTIKLDPCLRETCTNQRLEGKRETNGMSDIEVDSLDDEPANPEAQNSMISKTPVHTDSQCKSNNSPDYRAKLSRIPQLIRSPNKVTSHLLYQTVWR
ncbi:unnamed protein product [Heterobilharzia americana]|nr:unnamed protein product [Heterobilharzia americana]